MASISESSTNSRQVPRNKPARPRWNSKPRKQYCYPKRNGWSLSPSGGELTSSIADGSQKIVKVTWKKIQILQWFGLKIDPEASRNKGFFTFFLKKENKMLTLVGMFEQSIEVSCFSLSMWFSLSILCVDVECERENEGFQKRISQCVSGFGTREKLHCRSTPAQRDSGFFSL